MKRTALLFGTLLLVGVWGTSCASSAGFIRLPAAAQRVEDPLTETVPAPATSTPMMSPTATPTPVLSPIETPVSPLLTPTQPPSPLATPTLPLPPRPTPRPVLVAPLYRLVIEYHVYLPLVLRSLPETFTADALLSPLPTPTYPPPPEAVHVPIFMYHYVSPLPEDADSLRRGLTVVPELFEAQLQYLRENGYETVTLCDIYDALSSGKPLPEKPVVLTFDDGYKDAYTHVTPLLQQYGFVGEFFVLATPAHWEATHYLTWADMQAMAEEGMSVQGHGRDHYDLRDRDMDFLVYQILGIKEAVEAHTEQPVTFFCYPAGSYDNQVLAVVESAGYLGAVTVEWGTTERLDNRYTWPRIRVHGNWSVEKFIGVLEGLTP